MYTIEVLNNADFDNLGFEATNGSDISDSLGFANKDTNKAYVRYTEMPQLQRYLIDHELDELVMSESAHEDENGIRHKKFRDTAAKILPIIGAIGGGAIGGPIGAGIGGALGGGGGRLLSSEGGRTFKSVGGSALKSGALSFGAAKLTSGFGIPGSNVGKGIVTSAGEGVRTSGAGIFNRLGQGVKSGFGIGNVVGNVKNALGGFFGTPSAQAATAGTQVGATGVQAGGRLAARTSAGAAGAATRASLPGGVGAATEPVGLLNKAQGFFQKNPLAGVGLATAAGSQLLRSPQVPELPGSVRQFQQQAGQVGGRGQAALQELLSQGKEELTEDELAAIDRGFDEDQEDAVEQLQALYRNVQPGVNFLTNTNYKRDLAELQGNFSEAKQDARARGRRQVSQDFDQNRLQQILQSQNLDVTQLQSMLQAANFDVEQVVSQFNITDRDRETLRNFLLTSGTNLFASQVNPQQGLLQSLFGVRAGV